MFVQSDSEIKGQGKPAKLRLMHDSFNFRLCIFIQIIYLVEQNRIICKASITRSKHLHIETLSACHHLNRLQLEKLCKF